MTNVQSFTRIKCGRFFENTMADTRTKGTPPTQIFISVDSVLLYFRLSKLKYWPVLCKGLRPLLYSLSISFLAISQ